jgi:hypothetical protein
MENQQKSQIIAHIKQEMSKRNITQNALAAEIGVSGATMSSILNEAKWSSISADKWNLLKARFLPSPTWQTYETMNMRVQRKICSDALENSVSYCISEYTGAGKTFCLKHLAKERAGIYFVAGRGSLGEKDFIRAIQRAMGVIKEGSKVEMIEAIIERLLSNEKSLLIIDEVDKLKDSCLMIMKEIYDNTPDVCGWVLAGNTVLKERMTKFCSKNKLGYREFSRRFCDYKALRILDINDELSGKDALHEMEQIARINGIEEDNQILEIQRTSKNYGDLKKKILYFQKENKKRKP